MTESDVTESETTEAIEELDAPEAGEAQEAEESAESEETQGTGEKLSRVEQLEQEGDIAADYLEELLDIADLDGDLDMDVEGDRAAVSIVGADLTQLLSLIHI